MGMRDPSRKDMATEDNLVYVLLIVAVVAVFGLALSLSSFVTDRSMMGSGGMMGGPGGTGTAATGPGPLEWTVLILSVAFFALAVVLLLRGRGARTDAAMNMPSVTAAPAATMEPIASESTPVPVSTATVAAPAAPAPAPVPEPTLVKLLDEDERRMYLEIRAHGGTMLQRDLVASRMFSKAKVTRVLDKLEAKGVVVREAHGMTNRVRLTTGASR